MESKDAGYLTIRVSAEEKKWFESIAEKAEMSVSALLRYELEPLYKELERSQQMKELKAVVSKRDENWEQERLDLLHNLTHNATSTVRWIKNRMKHYERQVKRLEQFTRGVDDLQQKAMDTLAEDLGV